LSSNKTVSKIATGQSKPCGEMQVNTGNEKSFLAPLSIRKIPMVGDKTYIRLRNLGVSKIHTLQQMEVKTMQRVLGENGVVIWRKANGLDDSLVLPFREQKSMSKEHTYEQDTIDMAVLKKTIIKMIDQLAFDLRSEGRLTSCLTLKIRYSNFETFTKQVRIPLTSSDKILTQKVLELFEKLYSRRMLIRLIGIKLSELVSGSYQTDLFNDAITDLNLMTAMDKIRNRFGNLSVMRAASL
jgi:DNA polymerase-4